MPLVDSLEMRGRLIVRKRNRQDTVVEEMMADNAIVYTGRELVAYLFTGQANPAASITPISHLALGSDGTAVHPQDDTALKAEALRLAIGKMDVQEAQDGSATRAKVTITTELDFAVPSDKDSLELREAGLFNGSDPTQSVMYNRVVFPVITKTKEFALTFIWEITF
ncbi:MAG TPA: hypothetical protein VLQ80_24680 [Candidatus Saccharimonadia bacterium]|nr:hypothetical protein [Candidatus Saccharimonadia bacterium]